MPPTISVCIPVYHEAGIRDTILRLLQQNTGIYDMEIIVADYDPDQTGVTKFAIARLPSVSYVAVDKPGIAYARHQAITAARGRVIINFDADAYYSHQNAIKLMVQPILDQQAVLCVCDNAFNPVETEGARQAMQTPQSILDFLNNTQRVTPFYGFLECGSAMDKEAYMYVGGFKDVKMWELFDISPRLFFAYPGMKRWINGVVAVTSARRALASARYGVHALDYSNAYRSEGPVKVT